VKPGDLITTKDYDLSLTHEGGGYCSLRLRSAGNPQLLNDFGQKIHMIPELEHLATGEEWRCFKPGQPIGLLKKLLWWGVEIQVLGIETPVRIQHKDALRSVK
jgi:hypothetical protein